MRHEQFQFNVFKSKQTALPLPGQLTKRTHSIRVDGVRQRIAGNQQRLSQLLMVLGLIVVFAVMVAILVAFILKCVNAGTKQATTSSR